GGTRTTPRRGRSGGTQALDMIDVQKELERGAASGQATVAAADGFAEGIPSFGHVSVAAQIAGMQMSGPQISGAQISGAALMEAAAAVRDEAAEREALGSGEAEREAAPTPSEAAWETLRSDGDGGVTIDDPRGAETTSEPMGDPVAVAQALGGMVTKLLGNIKAKEAVKLSEAEGFVKLVVAYQKALLTALDLEKTLEQQAASRSGQSEFEVDVDRARWELMGELDRLAAED
ncbi:MAG: hypothetical protein AAF192_14925, partial [Pseudomonadota bacterium]